MANPSNFMFKETEKAENIWQHIWQGQEEPVGKVSCGEKSIFHQRSAKLKTLQEFSFQTEVGAKKSDMELKTRDLEMQI